MATNIAVRVDASAAIGLGHVKRCLSLAHALRACGAQVRFVTRSLGIDVAAATHAEGFACMLLPAPPANPPLVDEVPHAAWAGIAWHADAEQTVATLREVGADWIIVDHYAFDARWHTTVASALGCKLAAIDDLADRRMDVDLLVDHNLAPDHRQKFSGRLPARCVLLGGPRFALLGPAYAGAARYVFQEQVRSIGIFMGGTDVGRYSAMALRASRAAGFDGPVEVISTSGNPDIATLQDAVSRDRGAVLSVDLPDLAGFFARHDLQVGAGGGATWERCCIGPPTLAVVTAENQRQVLLPLSSEGVVQTLESFTPGTAEMTHAIRRLIQDARLRRMLSRHAVALVDGLGAGRVANRLLDT